ncbi:MAG TPA: hypothetical protein ENH52_08470 [Nitrospirae bacterium]|nr:hypothetical protein [Nitrospirota bacterium]
MTENRGYTCILLAFVFSLLLFISSAEAGRDVVGKAFYTTANIWYERPAKIYSTNYHKGAILPVGTKVTIKKVGSRGISFVDNNGLDYRIVYVKRHHPNVSVWDYFDQYFSEKDPMRRGGPYKKFSKTEQDNIKKGIIVAGMSKDAVLMSYGYPPSVKTPSLKSNNWVYMKSRFVTKSVIFKDNKVFDAGR